MTLIERLEQAEEGSRELDRDVSETIDTWSVDVGCGLAWPYFTTSIDAALTLVPDGQWWIVNSNARRSYAKAIIGTDGMHSEQYRAATPALALCAAALRAREQT